MTTTESRFETKYIPEPNTGCWIWIGTPHADGYGFFKAAGRTVLAHRYAYESILGAIPKGLEIDHLCRVRACVNPDHMEPVTHAENVRRGESGIRNKVKRSCPRGHEYTPNNTRWSQGSRSCKTCERGREVRIRASDPEGYRAYRRELARRRRMAGGAPSP